MSPSGETPIAPQVVELRDGRHLSWYEYGNSAGEPCLFLPGAGTSGLAGAALDAAASEHAIRLMSIDRPGLGHSDPLAVAEGSLLHWTKDVQELAAQLALGKFGVIGHSAGGAYALAVSRALPERVALTVIGDGSGPYDADWYQQQAAMSRMSRSYYGLARRAPRLFATLYKLSTPQSPKAIDRMVSLISRGSSPDAQYAKAHPTETRVSLEAVADGCRQGPQGPTDDIRRLCLLWGFELTDVTGPVEWWHGKQDTNVSLAAGRPVTDRLPHVETHFVDGGHYTLFEHADEVMISLQHAMSDTHPPSGDA